MPRASDPGLPARRKRLEKVLASAVIVSFLGVVNLWMTAGGSLGLVALGFWALMVLVVVAVIRRAPSDESG